MTQLVYIADPMCSWCYGFTPQLESLLESMPDAELELVMGGLRAYESEPMDETRKAEIRDHWKRVHEVSGQPFGVDATAREDFVYDTEPACRAVVTMRAGAGPLAYAFFRATQDAFYRDGRDVTRDDVLADVAAGIGVPREAFAEAFASDELKEITRQEFDMVQRWGINGFPTLLLVHGDELHLVASGYTDAATLRERIEQIRSQRPATEH
ncbi:MAG: DsbA family protein [Burkholderiaceae bacterium]